MSSVDLVGIKVTGDPNVPSGQATFCVSAQNASFHYECRCRYNCACPPAGSGMWERVWVWM